MRRTISWSIGQLNDFEFSEVHADEGMVEKALDIYDFCFIIFNCVLQRIRQYRQKVKVDKAEVIV